MPRGNRAILLAALLLLWFIGVAFLTSWYVAFSGFDGYEANVPAALGLYGGGGLLAVAVLYLAIGALMGRESATDWPEAP